MVFSGKQDSLLKLEIPKEVYQGFTRQDLGDIRIFDAAEKPVPFIIRDLPREIFTPAPEDVLFFLWDGGKDNSFPASTDIEINTSGGVVRIKNQSGASPAAPVYLIDLTRLEYTPSSLRVTTENKGNNFNVPVAIHYSRDLSNWEPFGKRQVLAVFGGNVQDVLDLPVSTNLRYLLLSYERAAPPPSLMTALFTSQEKNAEYHELTIQGQRSGDGKKVNYNTEAFYPAEAVDFILAEADSIPALIKYRFSESDEWTVRSRETLFRYNSAGGVVRNDLFRIATKAPFWELEAAGELPFSTAPEMAIRWKARELIFPGRGEGPWTLVYGNADCGPLDTNLPIGRDDELERAVFTGEQRYEKAALVIQKESNFRMYLLWAVLGAAVLILSILAYSIAKSMRK